MKRKRKYFLLMLAGSVRSCLAGPVLLWVGGLALLKYIGIEITWLWVFCPIWLPLLLLIVITAIALFFDVLDEL